MTEQQAVEALRRVCEAVAWNIAVWHRGGTGKRAGKAQERALADAFEGMTGRKPTALELEAMGGGAVFGGI